MSRKICMRAEGGPDIGMGHVMRMTELAQRLAEDFDLFFASKAVPGKPEVYGPGIDCIMERGFRAELLPTTDYFRSLASLRADFFLTDSYDVNEEYFDFLKLHFPVTAYMDDENDVCKFLNVDLIINQNPYAHNFHYRAKDGAKKLLGTDFLILRDEFVGKPPKRIAPTLEKVMVTVGGSDHENITEKILKQLLPLGVKVKVVIGGAFIHEDKLLPYASAKVELCKGARMSEVMDWCDVAVSACGSTVYELASMGVPALAFSVAKNQEMCLETMDKLGTLKRTQIETVGEDIVRLSFKEREKMSRIGQGMVDGKGKDRIAGAIKEMMGGA